MSYIEDIEKQNEELKQRLAHCEELIESHDIFVDKIVTHANFEKRVSNVDNLDYLFLKVEFGIPLKCEWRTRAFVEFHKKCMEKFNNEKLHKTT